MPIGGARFIQSNRYNLRSALGLALGGIPGVLAAAFIVKSLPKEWFAVAGNRGRAVRRTAHAEFGADARPGTGTGQTLAPAGYDGDMSGCSLQSVTAVTCQVAASQPPPSAR